MNNIIRFLFLSMLIAVCFWILQPFLLTLLWAFIISFVLFPVYQFINRFIENETVSAGVLTAIITVIFISVTVVIFNLIETEISGAYQLLTEFFAKPSWELPEKIRAIPHLGDYLQNQLNRFSSNHNSLIAQIMDWFKQSSGLVAHFFGSVGERTIKLCFVLVTVFFCLRDGRLWLQHITHGLHYVLGDSHILYLQIAGDTTRAVVYGLVLAAMSQGFVAGIGYFVAGVKMPLLLAMLTALLALIPMGATLVWLPISLILIINNELFAGLGLLAWGFFAVSTIDNVIRPLVICGASKIPFLIVMFGVFGGLSTFGAIGLFLGPVMLSLLLLAWKNFIVSTQP